MKARSAAEAMCRVLVDELVRAGVEHACISPGSRSTPVALSLAESTRIRLHVSIDERSTGFLAVGIGKATGRPAVILSTSGSAAANFHPAVLEAHHSRTPVLVITADRPPELLDTGANQTIDQRNLYGNSVRWFVDPGVPDERPDAAAQWRSMTARAIAAAVGSPAGPVHMNLSFREPLVPSIDGDFPFDLEGRPDGRPWHQVHIPSDSLKPETIDELAQLIGTTERGVVVGGPGSATRPHAAPEIVRLAESAGWPVLADPLSGLRWGSTAVSSFHALLLNEKWGNSHRPEVVLRFGAMPASKPLGAAMRGAHHVLVDPDGAWLDPDHSVSSIVAADAGHLALALCERLTAREPSEWLESWLAAEAAARVALDRFLDSDELPSEPRTARDVARFLDPGALLAVASSMPVRDLEWFMDARRIDHVIGNRGTSGIDGFVSTAVGAALGASRPVFALSGDLSLLHDANGLIAGSRSAANVTFVVLNNDGGGIFSFLPQARLIEHFEKLWGTPHGIELARLAETYGCNHTRLERASELEKLLGASTGRAGIDIIEVTTDRTQNVELHRRAWDCVAAAVN